jgi:Tn3 transposase DDE domain
MLDNTLEISAALNTLAREGCIPTIDELAALSPYLTRHIKRFGNYEPHIFVMILVLPHIARQESSYSSLYPIFC